MNYVRHVPNQWQNGVAILFEKEMYERKKGPLPRPFVFSFYVTLISVHLIKGVKHL